MMKMKFVKEFTHSELIGMREERELTSFYYRLDKLFDIDSVCKIVGVMAGEWKSSSSDIIQFYVYLENTFSLN